MWQEGTRVEAVIEMARGDEFPFVGTPKRHAFHEDRLAPSSVSPALCGGSAHMVAAA
jgi:hypothetical protein